MLTRSNWVIFSGEYCAEDAPISCTITGRPAPRLSAVSKAAP